MGCAGGNLLGKDRGDHLTFAIDIQSPFYPDQDIVCGAEADSPAPGDATAFALDDIADCLLIQDYRRQRLHRIGGTGWRGNRARRRFGHGEPQGGDDGYDNGRGAVAG